MSLLFSPRNALPVCLLACSLVSWGCAEENPNGEKRSEDASPALPAVEENGDSNSLDRESPVEDRSDAGSEMDTVFLPETPRADARSEEPAPSEADTVLDGEGVEELPDSARDSSFGEQEDASTRADSLDTEAEPTSSPWDDVVFPGGCAGDPTCANTPFVDVSAGMFHTCAVAESGEILCWGKNQEGQSTPPDLLFQRVWAGWEQTCGLTQAETVSCWGLDSQGQSSPPLDVTFQHVAIGRAHVCGVRTDAELQCWGENHQGMTTAPEGTFSQAAVGRYFSCGLRTDGTPVCFGDDSQGTLSGALPGPFSQLVAGRWHVCGLGEDGKAQCWGGNAYNQLEVPQETFTQLEAGWTHTCGLRPDGSILCWGEDHKGLLPPPTTGKKWDWVSAGDTHNCGLQEGKVLCWGSDAAAQTSSPGETQPDASLCAGVDCDDGDLCTTDSCLAGVCYHPQIICDDGDPCTGEMGKDYCDPETGLCQFPVWWDCDDGNPCTNDLCDGTGGCSHTPHNDFCEDGDACTVDDKCLDGQCSGIFNLCDEACVGEVIDCTDSDPCTTDYCDPQVGCLHQWIEDCF